MTFTNNIPYNSYFPFQIKKNILTNNMSQHLTLKLSSYFFTGLAQDQPPLLKRAATRTSYASRSNLASLPSSHTKENHLPLHYHPRSLPCLPLPCMLWTSLTSCKFCHSRTSLSVLLIPASRATRIYIIVVYSDGHPTFNNFLMSRWTLPSRPQLRVMEDSGRWSAWMSGSSAKRGLTE